MFCKWCGMESATTDQCSWCHRVFSTTTAEAAETAAVPPETEKTADLSAQAPPSALPEPVPPIEEPPLAAGLTPPRTEEPPAEPRLPWAAAPPEPHPTPAAPEPSAGPGPGQEPRETPRTIIGVRRPGVGPVPPPRMAPGPPAATPPATTSPSTTPASVSPSVSTRPVIPVRRPGEVPPAGSSPTARQHIPAPAMPPGHNRAGSVPPPPRPVPAPPPAQPSAAAPLPSVQPPVAAPMPPANPAASPAIPPSASQPQSPTYGTGSAPAPVPQAPSSRPAVPSAVRGGGPAPAVPTSRPSVPATLTSSGSAIPMAPPPSRPPVPNRVLGGASTATMPPTARPIAQPLGHGAAAAAIPLPSHAMPPARTETYPSAESGGLAEGVSARRSPTAPNPADLNVPTLGTFTATNSKYYSGQVIDAVSGTHYDAATGQVTAGPAAARREPDIEFHWDDNEVGSTRQLSRYAAFFAALLLVTGLCAHLFQAFYVIPLVLAQLAAGLLLPVMRVVPWQDEDSDDLWWLLGFSLVFGPGIGLIAYGVKALLLQEYNTAVIGIFIVGLLIYLATMIGAGGFTMLELAPPWTQVSKYGIEQLFVNWTVLVAMAGWFLGNVFHKFDQ